MLIFYVFFITQNDLEKILIYIQLSKESIRMVSNFTGTWNVQK